MKYLSKIVTKKISETKSFYVILVILFLALNILTILPKTANAGFFSFITDLGGDQVSAKSIDKSGAINSQNIPLPEAAVNSDPNPHKYDDNTPLLSYDNALYAEIGPQGTVSDVENRVSSEISLYTVRQGDTLSKVADMFDVSENTIMWANELGKNSVLKEGDMLVILPISGIRYTVKNGDTLKGIVLKYKSNLEEVLQYNDLTLSSTLVIGDTIVIPDAEPTNLFLPKIAQTRKIVTNKAHDTNGTYYPGFYIRPISGGVKSQNLHGYNAIDLAAPVGTVIRASASGKVISSISNGNWNGGYGNYVIISHSNGSQTLYAHNQKNFVRIGDYVEQGEMIAKIGMTGKTTGPHVHFEIRGAKNAF